jgi:hypothetical protein
MQLGDNKGNIPCGLEECLRGVNLSRIEFVSRVL